MTTAASERIRSFIYAETSLLDERRYAEWVALFADDGSYWLPAEMTPATVGEDEAPPARLSLVYDTKERLLERVARLQSAAMWSERPPSEVVRTVSNLRLLGTRPGAATVEGRLVAFQSRGGELNQYAGRVRYRLVESDGSFLIRSKQVVLLNAGDYLRNLGFIL